MQKIKKVKNFELQNRKTLAGSWISPKNMLITAKIARPISNNESREQLLRMTFNTNFTKLENVERNRH